ncbi:hypothetical protein ACTU45_34555 [Streptomyces sp. 24-1644]|uniref:hypothetical protein n=1 Tax=Streptomyces sp. 24-1644 TaxID=3457315 RepID=UPI003FA68F08
MSAQSHLGVSEELKLLFGISFGAADLDAPANRLRMGRTPLERSVVVHDTTGVLDAR